MIIGDFDVVSISIFPAEADAPVLVDPDAQLAIPVAFKGFQVVGRGISGSSKNGSSAAHMAHCLPHPARPASCRRTTRARPGPGVNLPTSGYPSPGGRRPPVVPPAHPRKLTLFLLPVRFLLVSLPNQKPLPFQHLSFSEFQLFSLRAPHLLPDLPPRAR